MADVGSQVIEIIAAQTSVEGVEVTPETRLEELEIESLDVVEILFAIEEKFDITVPYNASEGNLAGIDFDTVGSVVEAVEKLVAEKEAAG